MCLSETRTDQIDPNFFPEFYCIFADKKDPVHSFGGVHGLAILLSKKFDCKFQVLSETCSDCVLWIKLELPAFSALIGSVYVPHEGSKYYEDDWDDKIIDDCIKLKAKYNMPFFFNGRF